MGYKKHLFDSKLGLFNTIRQVKIHIAYKPEALFSSVPMAQRLVCRYLTAEK